MFAKLSLPSPKVPDHGETPKVIKPPRRDLRLLRRQRGVGLLHCRRWPTQPNRLRVRPPGNLQGLDQMVRGALVADVIAVIGTLDIVLGEVDR